MTSLADRPATALVIWVQHSDDNLPTGSPGWQLVPELELAASEPVAHQRYGDSFEDLREYGASPEPVIAHTSLYWNWAEAPGRKSEVVPSADIDVVHSD